MYYLIIKCKAFKAFLSEIKDNDKSMSVLKSQWCQLKAQPAFPRIRTAISSICIGLYIKCINANDFRFLSFKDDKILIHSIFRNSMTFEHSSDLKIWLSLEHDLRIVFYGIILRENHILAPLEYLINDISQ